MDVINIKKGTGECFECWDMKCLSKDGSKCINKVSREDSSGNLVDVCPDSISEEIVEKEEEVELCKNNLKCNPSEKTGKKGSCCDGDCVFIL